MQGDKKVANVYNINNNSYSVPIGCIIPFSGSTIPIGFLLCDGSEVSKTDYADLYAVIADLYGTCTDTTKFKLPDLRDRFVQGANGNLGSYVEEGLPNITGDFIPGSVPANHAAYVGGAFTGTSGVKELIAGRPDSTVSGFGYNFSASKSNSIYGSSEHVQPKSTCLHFVIKAEKVSDQYSDAVGALIDDTATDTNKTYSSSKINSLVANTYSTNEVKTNKVWVDGKPVYRKVISTDTPSVITNQIIGTVSNDIEFLVNIYGYLRDSEEKMMPFNGNYGDGTAYRASVYVDKTGNVYCIVGTEYTNKNCYIVVEYTKTTD